MKTIESIDVRSFLPKGSKIWKVSNPSEIINPSMFKELFIKWQLSRIPLDSCDQEETFSSIQIIDKNSASNTAVFLADHIIAAADDTMFKLPVAVKMFFEPKYRMNNNSLLVEAAIYKYYVSRMVSQFETPNLIGFVSLSQCAGKESYMNLMKSTVEDKNAAMILSTFLHKQNKSDRDEEYKVDKNILHYVVVEQARNSVSLKEYLVSMNIHLGWLLDQMGHLELEGVLFQIVYTLELLNRYGIRHNDLHLGNLFISCFSKEWDGKSFIQYDVDGKSFFVPARLLVQIFDWDRSSVDGYLRNHNLHPNERDLSSRNLCYQTGQCNGKNEKYDFTKLLCQLSKVKHLKQWPIVSKLLKYSISESLLNAIQVVTTRCQLISPEGGDFHPVSDEKDGREWAKSPIQVLQSHVFERLTENIDDSSIIQTYRLPSIEKCTSYSESISSELLSFQ